MGLVFQRVKFDGVVGIVWVRKVMKDVRIYA